MTCDKPAAQPARQLTISCLQTLKVYFDPLRARIMQQMAKKPRTVQQVAEALDVPFTRLYYHIKMLEKHNLIRVVDVVRLAGAVEEKYYQVTARRFLIERSLLTFDPEGKTDSYDYLLDRKNAAPKRDIRRDIITGDIEINVDIPHPRALLAREFLLQLSDEQAMDFQQELRDLLLKYKSASDSSNEAYCTCWLALFHGGFPVEALEDLELSDQ